MILALFGGGCVTSPEVKPLSSDSGPGGSPTLTATDVTDGIMGQEEAFSACIAAHRRVSDGPAGKLLMQWRVLPSGETREVVALTQSAP